MYDSQEGKTLTAMPHLDHRQVHHNELFRVRCINDLGAGGSMFSPRDPEKIAVCRYEMQNYHWRLYISDESGPVPSWKSKDPRSSPLLLVSGIQTYFCNTKTKVWQTIIPYWVSAKMRVRRTSRRHFASSP